MSLSTCSDAPLGGTYHLQAQTCGLSVFPGKKAFRVQMPMRMLQGDAVHKSHLTDTHMAGINAHLPLLN